ncbi:hypothetical protein ALC53_07506 [Atta colombica]|uniref:Uncharacterized protein n=1 Tax=Atta colombica TaxID=520822 RepID=A0A151I359_9HYME|nr:hypothetical protein ALC53_07506 [Atta colombica]
MLQSKLRQTILKYTDYFLSLVEKCMEWSLPEQNIEDEKELGKTELVRPLPWLLFLPCLMMLRLIRVIVNIGAFIFNYPKITSSEMIKFVQKHRKYLHNAMKKDKKERYKLKNYSCYIKIHNKIFNKTTKNSFKVTTSKEKSEEKSEEKPEEKSVAESIDSTTASKHSMCKSEEKKQEEEEKEEREETLIEKINRLALENSEDDEDFEANEYSSSYTDSIGGDSENSNDDVSPNEIRDIIKDSKAFNEKTIIEQFLNAEQTFTLASNQKLVEPACEKQFIIFYIRVYEIRSTQFFARYERNGIRSSAKESCDKVEERFATLQRIDSLECCTSDRSSQEGNPTFYSPVSSDSDSDIPKDLSVSIAKCK